MNWFDKLNHAGIQLLGSALVTGLCLLIIVAVILFIVDRRQKRDAIRYNYPVLGRFRGIFIHLGEFFRQYFFALDREEMPFNRAERDWISVSSAGKNNTEPFGSTRNLAVSGTPVFAPAGFAYLDDHTSETPEVIFGPHTKHSYKTKSILNISAMSYGSLSRPAIQALSRGAKRAGCWLNTGEGGLSPWHLEGGCDVIFQIGTAKYGARDKEGNFSLSQFKENALRSEVKMIELKLAQGAKPGKGGILPAAKVSEEIARIRGIERGQDSLSPNRHKEIGNHEDLLDFIQMLREAAQKPVGIKTVFGDEQWLHGLCDAIHQRGIESAPDFITLDGGNGGTGAAPLALMDNVGLTLREALPILVDGLERQGLRERIKVICAGKLVTPAEVAWAYCVGADVVNTARGFMFSIGCIQAMRCHTNKCPSGITTHNENLQAGLDPAEKSVRVQRFVEAMEKDVKTIAHSCGVPHARALRRHHVRIVQPDGRTLPFSTLYPPVTS